MAIEIRAYLALTFVVFKFIKAFIKLGTFLLLKEINDSVIVPDDEKKQYQKFDCEYLHKELREYGIKKCAFCKKDIEQNKGDPNG